LEKSARPITINQRNTDIRRNTANILVGRGDAGRVGSTSLFEFPIKGRTTRKKGGKGER
jgi:hypothetical protein